MDKEVKDTKVTKVTEWKKCILINKNELCNKSNKNYIYLDNITNPFLRV